MLINTTKYGQLGNRLQLFAHFIAFSIANNQRIANPGFAEYAHHFENTRKDIFCRYPARSSILRFKFLRTNVYTICQFLVKVLKRIKFKNIEVICSFPYAKSDMEFRLDDPEFLKTAGKKIIFSRGYYFVDYNNLLKHADKIREYFRPLAIYQANIDSLIKKARFSSEILIGIHIRRGHDYKSHLGGKFFYEIDDFTRIMERAVNLFPDRKVGFLVCSDNLEDKDRFSLFTVTFGTNQIIEDMYSLAQCDYIIGTPSTYSRWACFYGNVPTYHIQHMNEEVSLNSFKTYEAIVRRHMETAPQFPRNTGNPD